MKINVEQSPEKMDSATLLDELLYIHHRIETAEAKLDFETSHSYKEKYDLCYGEVRKRMEFAAR